MSNTQKIKSNTKTPKLNKSKLNLNVINSANQKQFTTKTVTIPVDGKDYEVIIDQVFKTTKIEKMVMSFLQSDKIKKVNELEDSIRITYVMYLVLKEFTNLDIPNSLKFEEEINLIDNLINLGIFEAIFEHIPDEEIQRVNEYMQKITTNLNKILENDGNNEMMVEMKKVIEDINIVDVNDGNDVNEIDESGSDGDGK